ncbi:hypothetical protein L3Y34_008988 [Caenorhabditis briggsae]|uniref:Uncharacterized protein n=1 Tax=Caenorhabditis briggsae TaxID=6238 RepID=A0AAE9A680_CAEBR|nr:hypothetical protein L3Y34_008988 [Caenorhabditis briggsae]
MRLKNSIPENKKTTSSTTQKLGATPEVASSSLAEENSNTLLKNSDELEGASAVNTDDSEIEFDYKKIEERKNAFEAEMEAENAIHRADMETIRRNRELLDEENSIRMNPSEPRIVEVEGIIQENQNILFTRRDAEEDNLSISSSLLMNINNEFKTVFVEDDAVIRLGAQELTNRDEFPLLFIDGILKDTSEL